jgi:hypothetical protein
MRIEQVLGRSDASQLPSGVERLREAVEDGPQRAGAAGWAKGPGGQSALRRHSGVVALVPYDFV